jgi:hypothetical protein
MSTNNDELLYDEDDSVKFIQNYLPQELKGKFSNDDINYIVDLIYDFYESNLANRSKTREIFSSAIPFPVSVTKK